MAVTLCILSNCVIRIPKSKPVCWVPFFLWIPLSSLSLYILSLHPNKHLSLFSSFPVIMASSSISNDIQKEGVDEGKFIPNDQNVLQKHVAFFDRNHDGLVYPWETFQGFRAIGCGLVLSTVSAVLINVALSQKTRPGKSFSLMFPIEVKNIHNAKHGSDSGVYDTEGRFVSSKFEEIFSKHARTHGSALTSDELMGMLKANREPKDYKGWVGAWTEWKILYVLCKDKNGLLHKETIRAVYDGSLFDQMEKERASAKKKAVV